MLPIAVLVTLIGFLARSWLLSFVPAVNAMERFTPTDEGQRRGAIGPTTGLPKMFSVVLPTASVPVVVCEMKVPDRSPRTALAPSSHGLTSRPREEST